MRKLAFFPILILLLVSCQKEFEVSKMIKPENRLALECLCYNNCDTSFVRLQAACPLNDLNYDRTLRNINLKLMADDKESELYFLSYENNIYTYYTLEKFPIGTKISITASADDYPQAKGSTIILQQPNIELNRFFDSEKQQDCFNFIIRNAENQQAFYGVQIQVKETIDYNLANSKYQEINYSDVNWLINDDFHSPLKSELNEITNHRSIMNVEINGQNFLIFEDDGGITEELTINAPVTQIADHYTSWSSRGEYIHNKYEFKVRMFKLSKHTYLYLNPQTNFAFLGMGLVTPFATFGNVEGGYGLVEGMGMVETPWLENLNNRRIIK